jgi:hypothetical protein
MFEWLLNKIKRVSHCPAYNYYDPVFSFLQILCALEAKEGGGE